MITVADIISLPVFEHIELIAPCEGAERRAVRNVGILDCTPDWNEYSVYMPGELILSNLGFVYDDPALAEKSLITMIKRGVSAIAVKTVYNPSISDKVRQASTEYGVPVYLYQGGYHEMVAYQSIDLIKRDQQESDKRRVIDELLAGGKGETVRAALHDLAGVTGSTLQCFALALRVGDGCSLYATLDAVLVSLDAVKCEHDVIESTYACRYREGIVVFATYGRKSDEAIRAAEGRCISRILSTGHVCVGVGEAVPLADGDLSIHQALAAADDALERGCPSLRWSDLHSKTFIKAVQADRLFMQTSEMYRSLLVAFDAENNTELLRTAEGLVETYGDVKATALHLHQHPNTIRYRMRKAKAVLGMADETDRAFVYFLSLVFLADNTHVALEVPPPMLPLDSE